MDYNFAKHHATLEFDKVLERLSTCATTILGKARCQNTSVYNTSSAIERGITLTTEAKMVYDEAGSASVLPLEHISDCKNILKSARLGIDEILGCANTLRSSRLVKTFLQKLDGALLLKEFCGNLASLKELEDEIFSVFDSSGNVVPDASTVLRNLTNSKRDSEQNLKNKIAQLLSNPNFTVSLQDTIHTTRNSRTVFQVKASHKNKVQGIVHDTSASGQTFFIEPVEIVPINNKIRQLESEINAEIERILALLSEKLHSVQNELEIAQDALVEVDFTFAKAKYSILTKSFPARLSTDKKVKTHAMRHPLLIGVVDEIVPNDFEIGGCYNSLIITGSNTGGKTVALKTVGLLVLMTLAGLHIPVLDAEIYPFDNVFADISEEQSLSQSLSTFSAHIKNVIGIIQHATNSSLVLFDELGAGTDPSEGAVLAQAILEYLSKKDVITLTTTHLGELKILQYNNSKFKNASVEFDVNTLKPTYKLHLGIAGSSHAISIATNLGLNPEITDSARELLFSQNDPSARVFEQIQQTHQELKSYEREAEESAYAAKQLREEYEGRLDEVKALKRKTIDSFKRKYQAQLESAREEIKNTLDELRSEKSEKLVRRSYARLSKLESQAREQFATDEDETAQKYEPIDWTKISIGASVLVKDLGQVATLTSLPDKRGNVEVQMGLIKSILKAERLAKTGQRPILHVKKSAANFGLNESTFSPRLDLRGYRVDEALDTLEKQLDLASLKNIGELTVIHGHGTGALKSALREYLSTSPYVSKYRPGEDGEGGDGVSVVYVN
ncbi:DNA mismatch repair protein MutS2 [Candidatus Gastranaerophilus sp. (ex Termes propinquus)]|nr:DNA mismatch repair protein MutS2 [Candidatus Gastranaerophilus sp. (ex Termes propinquus)]